MFKTLPSQAKNNNDNNVPSLDRIKTDESGDSEQESDNSTRVAFNKIVPDCYPVNNEHICEAQKISNDAIAVDKEHKRFVSNWIEH